MKNVSNVIGIDVSKLKIDACNYQTGKSQSFKNTSAGFSMLYKWLPKDDYFICFENTGYYSLALAVFLAKQNTVFSMVPPIQIKRSLGLVRGKSDVIDAYQIARYGWLHREELMPSCIPAKLIFELSQLLNVRDQFIKQKVALTNMLDAFTQLPEIASRDAVKLLKTQIKQIIKQIDNTENFIEKTLQQTELSENHKLLCTIKGVGQVLSAQLIVHTNNFKSFENWRKFACYAGLAPFEYQSGSSIKGRTKVHHIADKKLKSLINMAALSAIQHDQEIKLYYKRKTEEGKSKMCVLNAVRCKILSRAFSVIKRQTPYVHLSTFAA